MDDALFLHESDYAFLNKKDQLDVPVDVKNAYEKLNTPEFRKYARKMSWLSQCLDFGEAFYGVFDKDVLRKMFNVRKGFHISEEELERLCNEFPSDMTECHLEEGQRFIVAEYLAYDERYKELLDIWDKIQFNMDFTDIIRYLMDDYEDLLADTKIEQFVQLLQELNHNTRMQIHRGHTPNEIINEFELGKCRLV